MDAARASWGDPYQIKTEEVPTSPLSKDVKAVQLYTLRPLVFKGRSKKIKEGIKAFPVVNVLGGAAIVAGTYGDGRFFLASDISLFAPFRIEHGDNAKLLLNTLEWLTGRSLQPERRKEFLTKRFLSETDCHAIRAEEGRGIGCGKD